MPIQISRWQRYPETDRNALAGAALEFCRSHRTVDGVRTRFYWVNANELVFLSEAESITALNGVMPSDGGQNPAIAKAAFDLSDLAWQTEMYRAGEPGRGAAGHAAAGRVSELPR